MRKVLLLLVGLGACCVLSSADASEIGLPTKTFVQAWTPLPAGRFTSAFPNVRYQALHIHADPLSDAKIGSLLEDAFTSARDDTERRGIALSEMTAPWDQQKRTAFQRLRSAEAAYAKGDDARHARFAATLARVVDGTGRSVAEAGSSSVDLDKAYAAALARQGGDTRVAVEVEQDRWRTYDEAFAAFAEQQVPGSAAAVTAELTRQRVTDLQSDAR